MSRLTLRRRIVVQAPPSSIVKYGSLYLLLITFTLTEQFLGAVVRLIGDLGPFYTDPRIFWTIVYTGIGLTVLYIGSVVYYRTYNIESRLESYEWARLGLALCLLLLGALYSLLGSVNQPASATRLLNEFVISVLGVGLLSAVYLRAQGFEIKLNFPNRASVWMVGIAVVVPVLMVALANYIHLWTNESTQWIFDGRYIRSMSLVYLLKNVLIASTFGAFGTALLFHGAIQETLLEFDSPSGAILGTTVLIGFYAWVTTQMLVPVKDVTTLLSLIVATGIVVFFAALVTRLWRVFDLAAENDRRVKTTATVFGVTIVALLFVATPNILDSSSVSKITYTLVYSVTIGIAAATYERARSIWVPMLIIASFHIAVDVMAYMQFLGWTAPY